MWFILALSAAGLWGVGQIFIKKGMAHVSPLLNNVMSTIAALIFWIPFALLHGVNFAILPSTIPFVFIISIAYFIYYYVIGKGQVTLTGTILAMYPLATVLLSAGILHEQTSAFQKVAIIAIICGAVLLAFPVNTNIFKKFKLDDWVWWGFAGAIIIGVADFMAKVTIARSDAYTYLFALGVMYVPVTIAFYLFDSKGRKLPSMKWSKLWPTVLGVSMMEFGFIPFNVAFSYGLASLVSPLSSSYVIITVVLAYFFLKEKLTKMHVAGILVSVIGIILLGVT